jgi:hypothetical protein
MEVRVFDFSGGEVLISVLFCRFFPAVVHLTNSKLCMAIIGNLGFAVAFGTYKALTWVRV